MPTIAMKQDRSDQGKFMQLYDEPLAESPICVRYPLRINNILSEIEDRAAYLRKAAINQLRQDGLLEEGTEEQDQP